jgi:hypothetical protein
MGTIKKQFSLLPAVPAAAGAVAEVKPVLVCFSCGSSDVSPEITISATARHYQFHLVCNQCGIVGHSTSLYSSFTRFLKK